ncbi:DUF805 domain-containing protein [Lactobacillus selangorensis]|nr:DUF805 domain-containing protein [Lactobacillus selangorensis]KRN32983.1 hypothetical protein IV40_GL001047 [Lactobacillus selangorensis]
MKEINEIPGQVSFRQAFKDYWRGYAEFKGRSTRAGYWWMQLVLLILRLLVFGLFALGFVALLSSKHGDALFIASIVVTLILWLALFLPTLTLQIRRYRDAGLRGRGFLIIWIFNLLLQTVPRMVAIAQNPSVTNYPFFGPAWVTALGVAITLFFFVITILPTNMLTIRPSRNRLLRFFFRTHSMGGQAG